VKPESCKREITNVKNVLTTLAAVAFALTISPAYACGGGTCEPPKPPKKAVVAVATDDCGGGCGGGTCEPPKPSEKVLVSCGGGTCEPPKPPKKAFIA
jgi:hypothetical protein